MPRIQLFNLLFDHSLSNSFIHSFSWWFTQSLTPSLTFSHFLSLAYLLNYLPNPSLTYFLTCSNTRAHSFPISLALSITDSITDSLTHSLTHSFTCLSTHSLTRLLTRSLTHSLNWVRSSLSPERKGTAMSISFCSSSVGRCFPFPRDCQRSNWSSGRGWSCPTRSMKPVRPVGCGNSLLLHCCSPPYSVRWNSKRTKLIFTNRNKLQSIKQSIN